MLPRIHFCSRQWKINLSNLGATNQGDTSTPFELDFQAPSFCPLFNCFNGNSSIPWLHIRWNLVAPISQNIVYKSIRDKMQTERLKGKCCTEIQIQPMELKICGTYKLRYPNAQRFQGLSKTFKLSSYSFFCILYFQDKHVFLIS